MFVLCHPTLQGYACEVRLEQPANSPLFTRETRRVCVQSDIYIVLPGTLENNPALVDSNSHICSASHPAAPIPQYTEVL